MEVNLITIGWHVLVLLVILAICIVYRVSNPKAQAYLFCKKGQNSWENVIHFEDRLLTLELCIYIDPNPHVERCVA